MTTDLYLPVERACLTGYHRLRKPPPWAPEEFRSAFEAARQAVATLGETDADIAKALDELYPVETRSAATATLLPGNGDINGNTVRAAAGDFEGLGIPYDSLSSDLGSWREVIAPGAFSLDQPEDIFALIDHDQTRMLGRRGSGTLRLIPGRDGMRFIISGGNTTLLRDTRAQIERRDLAQCSFGFRVKKAGGDSFERRGDLRLRVVRKAMLTDISLVAAPAYSATYCRVCQSSQQRSRTTDKDREQRARQLIPRANEIERMEDEQRIARFRKIVAPIEAAEDEQRRRRMLRYTATY